MAPSTNRKRQIFRVTMRSSNILLVAVALTAAVDAFIVKAPFQAHRGHADSVGFVTTSTGSSSSSSSSTTRGLHYLTSSSTSSTTTSSTSTTRLHYLTPALSDGLEASRTAFFIWSFGASGAAGIARSAFPQMYARLQIIQSLKDSQPTLGGPVLGLSPLAGYPQDLSLADVQKIVNNPMSVQQIVDKFPQDDNFWSAKGYLVFTAFCAANPKANPLALRAVFDTFATSTDLVEPTKGQAKLDAYKADISQLKVDLLFAKLLGYGSVVVLLGLLGLADVVAFGHAYEGWFPDWPGADTFPACLFDKEIGPVTIPQYWVSDVPTKV